MTLEEAIKGLKTLSKYFSGYKPNEEMFEMAVSALKAQDATDTNVGNNDLISRSDAIDAVDKLSDEPIGYLEAAIDALVDLPSAQPERKTGRWIYKDDDDDRYDTYMCSECHHTITVDSHRVDDIGFVIEDMKYCNNCGTKMEGYDG